MTAKTPIRTVFNESGTATGLAEFQTGEFIAVEHGGTGAVTLTSNAILLGNGTSAIQNSAIGISGTTLSSTDSSLITIDEGLTVTGALNVTGTITGSVSGNITGNADTATTLETARNIAGQSFDGSADITIAATDLSDTDQSLSTTDNVSFNNLTLAGNLTVNGTTTTVNSTTIEITNSFTFEGSTADANETVLGVVDPTADRTINLPDASGTIVLKDTTDTLTNKTINSASNTITITESNISDLQSYILADSTNTLTNKTINLTSNTLTGTTAQFNSALSDGSFVTLAGSETLTNKTLTTPVISSISNTGTITLPTSTDTLVGRATTDTLTNKTIDADNNTITNIGDDELSSGISAIKIGNGDVDNTELSYLNGVTSAIQTQIDTKASTAFAIAQAVALG